VPDFDLEKGRYDVNDYWGRVESMKEMCDMLTLFTDDKDLAEAQKMIEEFK